MSAPTLGDDTETWIAIDPITRPDPASYTHSPANPPSFLESQVDGIILRRQRQRPQGGGGLKHSASPSSRFLNLSRDFEFAGWGSFSKMKLTVEEPAEEPRAPKLLGQATASALAGNDVLGGVFYTLPAVLAVSGVYSPIALFAATLTPFLWRPMMEELASAIPISGAPYSYMINVSRKTLAILGAALLLLDFTASSVVSAATAASYLDGEVDLPFPPFVAAAFIVATFALISLSGLKESARLAFVVLSLHGITMLILSIFAAIQWSQIGNAQLQQNWHMGSTASPSSILRQIFYGFCLGMLGLTGLECTPSYIGRIKPGHFPLVLRNLHLPAIVLNTLMSLLLIAVVPLSVLLDGANVLSVLAQEVVCGVLIGILGVCELLKKLAHDRVVPTMFLNPLPLTGAPYVCVLFFMLCNVVMYASSGGSLTIVSNMFSLVWLTVMVLFPVTLLQLRFNRGRLPRDTRTPLSVIFLSLVVAAVVFAGNVVIEPSTVGYFAAYLIAVLSVFWGTQHKVQLLGIVYWVYDQYPTLHRWDASKTWGKWLVGLMARLKRQPICILVKTDEINHLLHMILYVRENEETSCIKMVHFCGDEEDGEGIPSELEANAKILDEAFPEITIDLIIVQAAFTPANVGLLARRLQIPTGLMFVSCPGPRSRYPVAEFGTRVISL
ncbi:amino acid permease-domain-containing protein [Roridomyces roridus]|uniref:Amino acid permease-domain-containing protein n=1 Tax=Roridomyces roridus TaxID=1738132 RepID=A0AAD7BSK5_9AGAR|nr:amino acid permease-domain-containing protein [Roridomyces roridus]